MVKLQGIQLRQLTGMCARVSFEVECVVETFAAERAQISFDVAVTFDVPVEQAL